MRKDQIFVLMLVILLPMSGCFDGAVGDAEGEADDVDSTVQYIPNQHPIIYGSISNCYHECWDSGSVDSLVRVNDFFVVDPDGTVASFGLDFDNDFQIDWYFPWDWNTSYTNNNIDFNYSLIEIPEPTNPNSDSRCETGWMNLIVEDDLGLKEIRPFKWYFDWDDNEQECEIGTSN